MVILLSGLFIDKIKINELDVDSYVFNLPIVKNILKNGELQFNKKVTFFVGENGTGKSTLLEALAIAYGFNAEGGSRCFSFSTFKSHPILCDNIRLSRGVGKPTDGYFFRAESFYNVASNIDELDSEPAAASLLKEAYGGKSLHDQSHGESFMSLVLNRFRGNGLYILDEPEAALSPSRQFTLLAQMNKLVKQNSQFIIATHSPILIAYPDADIFELSDDGIKLTTCDKTENYVLTKQFLNDPQRMLKYLLED